MDQKIILFYLFFSKENDYFILEKGCYKFNKKLEQKCSSVYINKKVNIYVPGTDCHGPGERRKICAHFGLTFVRLLSISPLGLVSIYENY